MLMFPIVMEGGTLRHELYKYFDYNSKTLSNSAYCQQRYKIKDGTFNTLFHRFNNHYDPKPYKGKYQLMAADGCTFTFTRNPADIDAYYGPDGKSTKGFNQIHTVALYDLEKDTNNISQYPFTLFEINTSPFISYFLLYPASKLPPITS